MKRIIFYCFISLLLCSSFSTVDEKKSFGQLPGKVTFRSSDPVLNEVFNWAKKQALAYAFSDDPVGDWYEAALPGREAFCMRDVSHQAMGAHFLGLAPYTKNMLYKFAENISESKDWCSLWEINRYGKPALVDYFNEAEFWYNLPANFDILDCCYRMYILTGDQTYFNDPVFNNFYTRTVYDYVERWDLGIDKIMDRQRLMNTHGVLDTKRRFMMARGIPGYNEGDRGYIIGFDLVVTEHAAFMAYARFQQLRGNDEEAEKFLAKAEELMTFINTVWWDEENQQYYTHMNEERKLVSHGSDRSILYWGSVNDSSKLRSTLKGMVENLPDEPGRGIEGQSHLPEILYQYEEAEAAYKQLLFLFQNERREYPEASYSVVGAMVTGLMGVELEVFPPRDALTIGGYVDRVITSLSRLTNKTKWAEIEHIPIRTNDISVRHEGLTKTTFTNNKGPAIIWKAHFPGSYENLLLNGKPVEATTEELLVNGQNVSWIRVTVGAGETMTVQIPN